MTGGCGAIGSAIVQKFYSEGGSVTILDTCVGSLPLESQWINPAPVPYNCPAPRAVICDVSKKDQVMKAVSEVVSRSGGIDVLINNAAAFVFKKVDDASEEDWDHALSVNVKGYANLMAACVPAMRQRGGGSIVNVSSASGMKRP